MRLRTKWMNLLEIDGKAAAWSSANIPANKLRVIMNWIALASRFRMLSTILLPRIPPVWKLATVEDATAFRGIQASKDVALLSVLERDKGLVLEGGRVKQRAELSSSFPLAGNTILEHFGFVEAIHWRRSTA